MIRRGSSQVRDTVAWPPACRQPWSPPAEQITSPAQDTRSHKSHLGWGQRVGKDTQKAILNLILTPEAAEAHRCAKCKEFLERSKPLHHQNE